mmetsp:Transcript_83377/g.147684  ORF Transcript_83377/g.147684 Transcript_83377/m.147684 type:complete len:231 (-) Transcript_83377:442-1134(-)
MHTYLFIAPTKFIIAGISARVMREEPPDSVQPLSLSGRITFLRLSIHPPLHWNFCQGSEREICGAAHGLWRYVCSGRLACCCYHRAWRTIRSIQNLLRFRGYFCNRCNSSCCFWIRSVQITNRGDLCGFCCFCRRRFSLRGTLFIFLEIVVSATIAGVPPVFRRGTPHSCRFGVAGVADAHHSAWHHGGVFLFFLITFSAGATDVVTRSEVVDWPNEHEQRAQENQTPEE